MRRDAIAHHSHDKPVDLESLNQLRLADNPDTH